MPTPSYVDLLKDPRWQRKRLEILQRDDFTCLGCADTTTTLHVHHRRYVRGRKPWEYDNEDLQTLCETCHEATTKTKKLIDAALSELSDIHGFDRVVLGFVEALVSSAKTRQPISIPDGEYASGVACLVLGCALHERFNGPDLLERAEKNGGMVTPHVLAEALAALKPGAP